MVGCALVEVEVEGPVGGSLTRDGAQVSMPQFHNSTDRSQTRLESVRTTQSSAGEIQSDGNQGNVRNQVGLGSNKKGR